MNRLTHEDLTNLRNRSTKGCRVKLIRMNDPYRFDLKEGAVGTVMHVDDISTIHIVWACGSTLGVVYGENYCTVVNSEGGKQND